MATIYEGNLVGYPYKSSSQLGIPLNSTIIGSLTSRTDVIDIYYPIIDKKTLINLKFNVDQSVTTYDYYILNTPVGSFYIHPNYTTFPSQGVNFYINPWKYASWETIEVQGSERGVFKLNYTLEINEVQNSLINNLVDSDNTIASAPAINVNQFTTFWAGKLHETLKVKVPILPNGVNGTLTVKLVEATGYYDSTKIYNDNVTQISLSNEGGRRLDGKTFKLNDYLIVNNAVDGDYYINTFWARGSREGPMLTKYEIGFYEIFSNTKTVAHNSNLADYFSDWSDRLDTVVFADSFSNYQIMESNIKAGTSGTMSLQNKSNAVIDKMNVERVVFSDKTIAFDFSSSEAGYKSAMLIAASFGKEYIPTFFSKGLSFFDSGSTTKDISKLIVDNKFIEQLIGENSDSAWVKHVYKNVVGVYPDKASETNYVTLLQNKTNTRSELLELAAGFTFLETRIDLVGLQTNGLVFDTLS
jgi:hypothetical protein